MLWTRWISLACFSAALAVSLGAIGSHALKSSLSSGELQSFETAVRYHMYHSLALLGVALVASHVGGRSVSFAGGAFCLGILLFSGSIYLRLLTGVSNLHILAPIGGGSFILGWIALGYACMSLS